MGVIYNRNRKNALLFIPSGGLGPSVSAAFDYSAASFTQADSNPTPTIEGTTGGTFSATSGLLFVDSGTNTGSSTGQINLSASSIAAHVVTYTVDGVSQNFNLSVTAAPYASTSSFSFDGVNDYFSAGIMPTLNNVTQFSISGWYKFNNTSRLEALCANGGSLGGSNYNFLLQHYPSNNVSVFIANALNDNGSNYVKTNNNFITSTSEWYHITIVYNGTLSSNVEKAKIYVNGNDVTVNGAGAIAASTTNTSGSFNIGQWEGIGRYFDGNIDEVSIWDSALSSAAVTEIYNSGAPNDLTSLTNASSSNLKAWYKM